jgi:hypothetical protein
MSVKSTVLLTRQQALTIIVNKILDEKIKELKKEIFSALTYISNSELEKLLDEKYYNSEFENYAIED